MGLQKTFPRPLEDERSMAERRCQDIAERRAVVQQALETLLGCGGVRSLF